MILNRKSPKTIAVSPGCCPPYARIICDGKSTRVLIVQNYWVKCRKFLFPCVPFTFIMERKKERKEHFAGNAYQATQRARIMRDTCKPGVHLSTRQVYNVRLSKDTEHVRMFQRYLPSLVNDTSKPPHICLGFYVE